MAIENVNVLEMGDDHLRVIKSSLYHNPWRVDPFQGLNASEVQKMQEAYSREKRRILDNCYQQAHALDAPKPAPADPYAPFKEAIKAGKVIQLMDRGWRDIRCELADGDWFYPPCDYRIKPDPTPEPATIELQTLPEGSIVYTRDKTYTVTVDGDNVRTRAMVSTRGTDATVTVSLRRPSDGPAMEIPEPQFPYTHVSEPSTALPAVAGLMRVWQDQCWARR